MIASRFVVGSRRGFWWPRALGAVGFAIACGIAASRVDGAMLFVAALGGAMFGAFALYGLRQALRRGPRLMFGDDGVDVADLGVGTIPWRDIAAVEAFGSDEAPFVAFHVADADPWLARLPAWPRFVAKLLRAQGLPYFSVNLIGADRSAHEVAVAAERHRLRARDDGDRPCTR